MSLILLNSDFEVENRFQYSWNILKAVEKDIGYSWNILEYVEKALGYSWSYEVWVERALEYSWNIKDWIKKQLGYSWNIFATAITSETFVKYEFSSAKRPNAFYIDILNKVKLFQDIVCPGECGEAAIGYTSQQMSILEEQALTVENSVAGYSYDWEIISGGGSLSLDSGLNTVYIAPSTNQECAYNPVITLSVAGVVCDTLAIAVNSYQNVVWAARIWSSQNCEEVVSGIFNCGLTNYTYDCAGDLMAGYPCVLGRQSSGAGASCAVCYEKVFPSQCYSGADSINTLMSQTPIDLRTDPLKTAGCCPEQLLPI